jgi:hypothetical protein
MLDFPEPFNPVIALKWGSTLYVERQHYENTETNGQRRHSLTEVLPFHYCFMSVGLEAINDNFLDVHSRALEMDDSTNSTLGNNQIPLYRKFFQRDKTGRDPPRLKKTMAIAAIRWDVRNG